MIQGGANGEGAGARLLESFPVQGLDRWQEEVVRLLKGASFEKRMFTTTIDGIRLRPIYTAADTAGLEQCQVPPGSPPYLRGTSAPGEPALRWEVAQELPFPDPAEFNRLLRHDLERGQTAVNLVLDDASAAGLDPGPEGEGRVGRGGTSVSTLKDLQQALDGVDLERTPLFVRAGPAAPVFGALLAALCRKRGTGLARLSGAIGFDPLAEIVSRGGLPVDLERAWDGQALLTRWAERNAPGLKTIAVEGFPWSEAGAGAVQELACTMAGAVQALREAEKRGIETGRAAARCFFSFSVGTDFFTEIAKFRAARLLWARIAQACGGSGESAKLCFHARSSGWSSTLFDPHTNILRSTTQAFAAIAGGCGSLHLSAFDERFGLPGELSRRLARNTQLILRDESHFDRVADPAGGSWYVEALTDQLARKAWELFQELEAGGGMEQALRSGRPQEMAAATAGARQKNLALGTEVLVGTNRYANPGETPLDVSVPDYLVVEAGRLGQLEAFRREAADTRTAALARLDESSFTGRVEDLELMAEAARDGVTLGELSRWYGSGSAPERGVQPLPGRRGAEPFETLRTRVSSGRPPRVLLAAMGPPAGYMARLEFARSFYQVGGFEVLGDLGFDSMAEVTAALGEHRPAAVCIVSSDDRYAELVPELAAGLLAAEPDLVLHVAGGPPGSEEVFLEAGVHRVIGLRSDVPAVLAELAQGTGVSS